MSDKASCPCCLVIKKLPCLVYVRCAYICFLYYFVCECAYMISDATSVVMSRLVLLQLKNYGGQYCFVVLSAVIKMSVPKNGVYNTNG